LHGALPNHGGIQGLAGVSKFRATQQRLDFRFFLIFSRI
jgi:hypothetical protein